ncbi:MAG TPA: hypothetical protein DGG94_01540 [Micromonosporaceae bacterium]|nr:hypothetical protein [Micromonosporaceae bacterium]HCU48511.1 hypothetical protein [Micromonosporaceae bacterium]
MRFGAHPETAKWQPLVRLPITYVERRYEMTKLAMAEPEADPAKDGDGSGGDTGGDNDKDDD